MCFERHSRKDRQRTANLDFDARVPIPFSVFPSSYRSDAVPETTLAAERVEGEVHFDRTSRVEREDTRTSAPLPDQRIYGKEELDIHVQSDCRPSRRSDEYSVYTEERIQKQKTIPEIDLARERYREPTTSVRIQETQKVYDQELSSQLDITEREYRRRVNPTYDVYNANTSSRTGVESYEQRQRTSDVSYDRSPARSQVDISYDKAYQAPPVDTYAGSSYGRHQVAVEQVKPAPPPPPSKVKVLSTTTVVDQSPACKMGYYDDDGNYHSFRRGVERAADRIMHPFHHHDHHDHHHHHHHDRQEVVVADDRGPVRIREGVREEVRIIEPRGGAGHNAESVPIPCHFIRIGDILILQGRPCQVIRISVSPQTGQHRYLGVDLFTRQLQEESSFISNPSPSVVVQTMLGPVYKTYRILDLRDGEIVAMTETGDVKQGIPVVPQGHLFRRIKDAFEEGRGSVRALVINDGGRELVVDYKVIHASRL
ncbi:putative Woronin body protein hexa [Aspergillus coremiiformis]|uniref:Putative Woronin body protein hexa n=1 Tax=Aspergillus coremiiformis TaxID=138285 RepID=A0A5N6YUP2_9EURO|nr:putative Woronin body protein hexa [Aspergillus coremiiformis]